MRKPDSQQFTDGGSIYLIFLTGQWPFIITFGGKMDKTASRYIKVGDWMFEVKMVRAIRVEEYGQPYDAVAHMTFNGDEVYVDSQLSSADENLGRKDLDAFLNFAQMMDVRNFRYDRFQNGKRRGRNIKMLESVENAELQPNIRLVK